VQANEEQSTCMVAPAESSNRSVDEHVREAHEAIRGEHQIAEYVARLEVEEYAMIHAFEPGVLPRLAGLRDECCVGANEERSFEGVIGARTEAVLSGVESG
jgi:hypothetical protein